jgi:hypothetical protein
LIGIGSHVLTIRYRRGPGPLRRLDQLHRAAVVHRLLARGPSGTGASGEHHRIAAGDRRGDVLLDRLLQINHRRLGARSCHLVRVVGIADQGDDSVAALRQDPGETQGDLAVAAGNGYTLASAYVRGWPASLQVVWFVLALIQSERRILVPHQGDIDQDPVEPAIDAHK